MKHTYYEKILTNLGYSVDKEGNCISKSGKILTGTVNTSGYIMISTRLNGKTIKVSIHRLQAYQKFGDDIYEEGIEVRHLDGIRTNNSYENIEIGTSSDNKFDIPIEIRKIKSSDANKKYSDELVLEIKEYYNSGHTYKETMEKFNISSKGTLSYIINNR